MQKGRETLTARPVLNWRRVEAAGRSVPDPAGGTFGLLAFRAWPVLIDGRSFRARLLTAGQGILLLSGKAQALY